MTALLAIRVNRIIAPVTTLGPGIRVGLWLQGCTIGCPGCASTDTWPIDGGVIWDVDALADRLAATAHDVGASGLSITGGEPFQQAAAVAEVIERTRGRWTDPDAMDALVFTGYAARAAARLSPRLWKAADLVVAGPYRRNRPADHPLLASDNQTLEVRSPLGSARLAGLRPGRRMQVMVRDGAVSLVGLPEPGDLERLRSTLLRRGVRFGSVSWQDQS